MRVQLLMALRYLRTRKTRTALTTLAILFGVAILFGMNTILPSMMQVFRQGMLAAAGEVDLVFSSVTDGPFPADRVEVVRQVEGVAEAAGSLRQNVLMPASLVGTTDPLQGVNSVTVVSVEPEAARRIRMYPTQKGRFLEPGDGDVVVISQGLAEKLSLDVGDTLTLPSAEGTTSLEVVGVLQWASPPGTEEVYVPLTTAQRLLNMPGQVNGIEVILKPQTDRAKAEQAILAALGEGFQPKPLELGEEMFASLQIGEKVFGIFGVAALAIGAFIILNTFRTVVTERRHDLGMLRAVGASRRAVVGLILTESLLQGALGTILGLLAGYGLAALLVAVVNPVLRLFLRMEITSLVVTPQNVVAAVVLGLGATLVGGLWPALTAGRVTPLEALRPVVPGVYERATRRRAVAGAVLLVLAAIALLTGNFQMVSLGTLLFLAGLVLVAPAAVEPLARLFGRLLALIFAREGRLAEGNIARQPNRAAVTASAIMIGLAMVVALTGMVTSVSDGFMGYVERTLRADLLVMPTSMMLGGGNVGAGPEMARSVREIPGVAEVATLRLGAAAIDGQMFQVVGIDPQRHPRVSGLIFSQGDPDEAYAALGRERALIVNAIFAAQNRIQPGTTTMIQTPTGKHEYRIVAVASDYLNAKLATAYVSHANLERDFGQTADLLFMVDVDEGADFAAVRGRLEEIVRRYPAFILVEQRAFRQSQEEALRNNMTILYLVMALLVVPSLLATANTLVINVMERTREIGVLRAVGSTRRQVRRMILAESLLLSALGAAFGILAGLWLGYVMTQAMNTVGFIGIPYYFPYAGILGAIALGLLIGVAAAVLPARRAARLDIVAALRYE